MRLAYSLSIASLVLFISTSGDVFAQKRYGPGATDTEIKIGQTVPYSGPASVYGRIGLAQIAYFAKVNAEGGINGRKVRLISLDDAHNPAKTVEHVRRLIEEEQVLLIFSSVGTTPNLAVRKYLNARKIPHLFVAGGDAVWADYRNYPWTMGWGASYQAEGALYAQHILNNHPAAKIAILSLNDEFGRDYVKGFKDRLGERASAMIVAEQTYELSDPTVDSQIISLKASGADAFFGAIGGKQASQAYRKMYDIGWRPHVYLSVAGTPRDTILKAAGFETAVGFISAYWGKDASILDYENDPAVLEYIAWAGKWYGDSNAATDGIVAYGYQVAQALEYVLRRCGDDLTRENVMRVATSMDHVSLPMLAPGVTATTSPTDYYPIEQFRMSRFDGKNWRVIGGVMSSKLSDR